DRPGVLASITSALLAEGFSVQDVQAVTYEEGPEPALFVDSFRVLGKRPPARPAAEVLQALQERLDQAFRDLAPDDDGVPAGPRTGSTAYLGRPGGTGRGRGLEGAVLDREYVLRQHLATGGSSDIYLADRVAGGGPVVIKLVRAADAEDGADLA